MIASTALTTSPAQVVVLGMHRSGTSAVTRVLNMMGLWVGPPDSFPPADDANPTGYWEYREVWALNEAVLGALGATWCEVADLDLGRLGPLARAHFEARARSIVDLLDRGGPWVIKDPRLCVLFPLWRQAIRRPICVLVHRDPLSVARSLHKRDGSPLLYDIALWELYNRQALAASRGLPRILLSYRELIDDPMVAARRLHRDLVRLGGPGAAGLQPPSAADLSAFVAPSLDRHPRDRTLEQAYLNRQQIDLQEAFADGTALDLDPVPPLSAGAREVLASASALSRSTARSAQLGSDLERADRWLTELDGIISALFASRTWKLGATVAGLARRLLRSPPGLTAADRRNRVREEVRRWRAGR